MAKSFIKQKGVNKLRYRFEEISRQTMFGTVSTLEEIGKDLKAKSQARAPYDEDRDVASQGPHLRDTAYYGVFRGPQGPCLEVGYQKDYAIVQHEELDYHHDQGEAKYLEGPFVEERPRYAEMLLDAARRPLRD